MNITKKRSPTLASNDYLKKGNSTLFRREEKRQIVWAVFLKMCSWQKEETMQYLLGQTLLWDFTTYLG